MVKVNIVIHGQYEDELDELSNEENLSEDDLGDINDEDNQRDSY